MNPRRYLLSVSYENQAQAVIVVPQTKGGDGMLIIWLWSQRTYAIAPKAKPVVKYIA